MPRIICCGERRILCRAETSRACMLGFKLYWQTGNYPAARETLLQLNRIAPSEENTYWLNEVEKKLKP